MANLSLKQRYERQAKVSNLVRQFNAKITRLSKKNPKLSAFLPKRIKTSDFMDEPDTKLFRRKFNAYSKFLEPGQEKIVSMGNNVVATKWEINRYRKDKAKVNAQKREKQKKIDYRKGTQRTLVDENLHEYKIPDADLTMNAFRRFRSAFEQQLKSSYTSEMNELYKQNYLKALDSEWQGVRGYQEIRDLVSSLPAEVVGEAVYFDDIYEIHYIYQVAEREHHAMRALDYWTEISEAYHNGVSIERIRQAFDTEEDYGRWEDLRAEYEDNI